MTNQQLVAVAYDIQVDGWSKLVLKHLRNPEHSAIVWMMPRTWQQLATHATANGEFYIPCRLSLTEPDDLRALVLQKETT